MEGWRRKIVQIDELPFRIYHDLKMAKSAEHAKQEATKEAEILSGERLFADVEKIYKIIGEPAAALAAGKKAVAHTEAVRAIGLGKHLHAEKHVNDLAKLGEYGLAAELFEELAGVALSRGASPKAAKLRQRAQELRARVAQHQT